MSCKVMSIFGTRPEAIKMCPLVLELENTEGIDSVVCVTGQHREMLDQVLDIFRIKKVDYDLAIMKPEQTLTSIAVGVLENLGPVLEAERPDIVLVHGDTSTSFIAALAAFYRQIPVGHVEAGLRTFDKYSPFPEEINRTLTGHIATLHFAPTHTNLENLHNEGVKENVFITGNTVIDAFKTTVKMNYTFRMNGLNHIMSGDRRIVLVTAHRRENLGRPFENICNALARLARDNSDIEIVYPVHLNPAVREPVFRILGDMENVHLIDPIDVEDMHNLMAASYLVMTDSGGLQEEAPSLGVPVLVLRTETERPEAVAAGTVRVVGVEEQPIYEAARTLLHDKGEYDTMAQAINPYGDGHASARIAGHILQWHQCEDDKSR